MSTTRRMMGSILPLNAAALPILNRATIAGTVRVSIAFSVAFSVAFSIGVSFGASTADAQTPRTTARAVAPAAKAPADTVAYVYLKGADTVAIERIVNRADGLRGELVVKNQPRLVWQQHISGNIPGAFDLDVYASTAGVGALPAQSVTLRMAGDSGYVDVNANGVTNTTQRLKVAADAEWMMNSSVLHTDALATLALKRKQDTVNVVLTQGGAQFKMALRQTGDTIVVTMAGSETRLIHDAAGLKQVVIGDNLTVRRVSAADQGKLSAASPTVKLSYAAPAGAPYTAEDVVINTEAGFQLAGTLTRPLGANKMPVVITISGSGEQERDSRLAPVSGYAIFRDIADTLGRRGIAVLRVDDRGVGASTGRETRAVATSADYAQDVKEVLRYVRSRSDLDANHIALLGHSEGGMIAPMVASQDQQVAAIVLLAGPAYSGRKIMMFQNQDLLDQTTGLSKTQRDSIMATLPARLDSAGASQPWLEFFMQHDPLRVARQVKQPVLILQGETDHQITPEQADTLAATLRAAGNADVTVRRFPDTNHLFLIDSAGVASGYASLKDTHVRRSVLGAIADWLSVKLK